MKFKSPELFAQGLPLRSAVLAVVTAVASLSLAGCDQYVARNFGGKVTYTLPAGTQLVNVTWKGDSLWVLYYEPGTKRCVFAESASLNVLEGSVVINDCNPLMTSVAP